MALGMLMGWTLALYYYASPKSSDLFHAKRNTSATKLMGQSTGIGSGQNFAKEYPPRLNGQQSQTDFFQLWCDQSEYDSAIDFLVLLNRKGEQELFKLYRKVLFDSLNDNGALSSDNRLHWLDAYLSFFHDDFDFLVRKAELEAVNGQPLQALISLYDAQLYGRTSEQSKVIRVTLDNFIKQQTEGLMKSDPLTLTEMFDLVQSKEPQYVPLALHIAESYIHMNEFSKAEMVLSMMPRDGLHDQAISELQKQLKHEQRDGLTAKIPLQKMGDHYLANLEIEGYGVVPLLIDTGASYTTISRRLMDAMDSRYKSMLMDRVDLQTANGAVTGELYQLRSVTLGEYQLLDVTVVSVPLQNLLEAEGLLGMNILKRFEFSIDQERSLLLLR